MKMFMSLIDANLLVAGEKLDVMISKTTLRVLRTLRAPRFVLYSAEQALWNHKEFLKGAVKAQDKAFYDYIRAYPVSGR